MSNALCECQALGGKSQASARWEDSAVRYVRRTAPTRIPHEAGKLALGCPAPPFDMAVANSGDLRHYPPIDKHEIESQLAFLEQELQQVRQTADESDAALAALQEQQLERESQLQLARRAEEDFRRRIEEKRAELRHAEAAAAMEAYERSLSERSSAAERFASAAQAAVAGLGEYELAQEGVATAWEAVLRNPSAAEARKAKTADGPEQEPAILTQTFELLVKMVRERLDGELERDLVEAAARSPMGYDIQKLPAHLQALARERRLAIVQEKRGR